MDTTKPRSPLQMEYEAAAEAYLRRLPPEHFMEAIQQSTQRKITIESMDLVQVRRPDIQTFSELLVQYPLPDRTKKGQVVPDNMVVVWPEPIQVNGSFDLPLQPTGPFWVLEYVSQGSKRKDNDESFLKYERELHVPFYLLFYPDAQELTLYQLKQDQYVSVKPNEQGRYAIADLELEIGLLEGWARFWFRGNLLPLSGDLLRKLDKMDQQLEQANQQTQAEKQRADEAKRHALLADQRADEEKQRADEAKRHADEAKLHALKADQRAEQAEQELIQLRAQMARLRSQPGS